MLILTVVRSRIFRILKWVHNGTAAFLVCQGRRYHRSELRFLSREVSQPKLLTQLTLEILRIHSHGRNDGRGHWHYHEAFQVEP